MKNKHVIEDSIIASFGKKTKPTKTAAQPDVTKKSEPGSEAVEKDAQEQSFGGLTGYEKRPYCAADLDSFMKSRGISKSDIGGVFSAGGLSSSAFIRKIGTGSNPLSPPLQILFRMYLRHPHTIPMPERMTASDFFDQELGGEELIATRYRGVLFGVDRNSGYNWSKNSAPISHVQSTMVAAKKLREKSGLTQKQLLEELLDITNATTEALQVNPMKIGSWGRPASSEDRLVLTTETVNNGNIKMRGLRVNRKSTQVGDEFKRLRSLVDLVNDRLATRASKVAPQRA